MNCLVVVAEQAGSRILCLPALLETRHHRQEVSE